jgi:phosphoribosylaminoimidazole-succinocarboxamide synthase
MPNSALSHTFIPELGIPKKGKVRDIYENGESLTLITSDRISIFDRILNEAIPDKGSILNQISRFWFEQTKDIISNHLISYPDPNVMVVKKCRPIMVEMIVRGYLAGSMWRDYQSGKREKCGIPIPDGLKENDPLPHPIVTPTTKSEKGHDEDITKEELISSGIVSEDHWNEMEAISLRLFKRGQEIVGKRGLILVDTKYEFGLDSDGKLILIDEIHTPDSSRYWFTSEREKKQIRFPDKEFVRQWGRGLGFTGDGDIPSLPKKTIEEIRKGYLDVCRAITGEAPESGESNAHARLVGNLKSQHLIKGTFCQLILGSDKDLPHAEKITKTFDKQGLPYNVLTASAHKNTLKVVDLIEQLNQSLEPVVFITIAGRSNALSGVVAANTKWPVIACPPFKDHSDYLVNIHSSLQMPSQVPVMTVVDPGNAALAALRILEGQS